MNAAANSPAPFVDAHVRILQDRAIPIEVARLAGLRSVDAADAGQLLGWATPAFAALAIPYLGIVPPYVRLRVDSGPMRYLSPKDREVPVYVPSAIIGAPEIEGELGEALVVVEAPLKALSLAAAGLQTTGLGGVATTLDKHTRLNRSWDRFDLENRLVIVCFDSNRRIKPSVAQAEARLVHALLLAGARVRVADLPRGPRDNEEWGPDDLIAAKGADALLKVLAGAAEGDPLDRLASMRSVEQAEHVLDDGPFLASIIERGERIQAAATRKLKDLGVKSTAFDRAIRAYQRQAKRQEEKDNGEETSESPYIIDNDRFVFTDTKIPFPICNFTARVVEDITVDDGSDAESREFVIAGETVDKQKLPRVTVPAGEFSAASAHWPSIRWGHIAIVHADCQQHIRPAILYFSPDATKRSVLAHTGFRVIDGHLVYLTQSGAVGAAVDAQVHLDSTLTRYSLPTVPAPAAQVIEGVRAILLLVGVAPDRVTIPLIAAGFRAPLGEWLSIDLVVWLHGPTGSLKSTLAALILRFYGATFDREKLTGSWMDTYAAIETKLFRAKDTVFVLDDYAPRGVEDRKELQRKAAQVVRGAGNGSGRSRMRSDMTARPDRPPRCLVLSTGEDTPHGESIVARTFPVAVRREDIDLDKLSEVQRHAHLFPDVMRAYVEFIIAWVATDPEFPRTMRARFEGLRSEFSAAGHLRAPAAAAHLAVGWQAFIRFAYGIGAITGEQAEDLTRRGNDALRVQLAAQQVVSTQEEPVERFLRWLRNLLATGRVRLSLSDEPITQLQGSETIGWILSDGRAHVLPEPTFATVMRAMNDARESLALQPATLWGRLHERGFATAGEHGRHTVQRRHGGGKHRVVELLPHALNPDGNVDDDPPGGGASPPSVPSATTLSPSGEHAQHAVPHQESGAVPGVPGVPGGRGTPGEEICVNATDNGTDHTSDTRPKEEPLPPAGPGTPGTEREKKSINCVVTGGSVTTAPSPTLSPPPGTPGTLITEPWALPELARAVAVAGVVGLDLETTGLDPLTSRPRLLQLGLADGRAVVVDLFATGGLGPLAEALGHVEAVGHNLAFDLAFLRHHFGVTPRAWDTMLASQLVDGGTNLHAKGFHKLDAVTERLLGVRLEKTLQTSDWSGALTPAQIAYASADVAHLLPLRAALYARLRARSLLTVMQIESDLLPAIVGMELAGVPIDVAALATLASERGRLSAEARQSVRAALRIDNPNSPKQLLPALRALGFKVDASNAEALAPYKDNSVVRDLQTMRTEKTVIDRAIELAEASRTQVDGRVRPSWWQIGAPTGRMATSVPNMLGLPKDPGMRMCIAAPEGRTFVIADYAAIELRVLAHVTGDKRLTAVFRAGGDPHRALAAILLSKPSAAVTTEERKRVKPVNFGFCFGMGADRFVAYALKDYGVSFTLDEARKFKGSYLGAYGDVDTWQKKTRARMDREVRTVAGRVRDFTNSRDGYTERLNLPIQGTAADGMKRAMAILAPRLAELDARIVLVVHDELVVEAPETAAAEVKATVEHGMVEGMSVDVLSVPIVVEAEVRRTWGKT